MKRRWTNISMNAEDVEQLQSFAHWLQYIGALERDQLPRGASKDHVPSYAALGWLIHQLGDRVEAWPCDVVQEIDGMFMSVPRRMECPIPLRDHVDELAVQPSTSRRCLCQLVVGILIDVCSGKISASDAPGAIAPAVAGWEPVQCIVTDRFVKVPPRRLLGS